MLTAVTITRLEKAATDNGFDLALKRTADWLSFGSSQASMRIWLTAIEESRFLAGMSRADVLDGLAGLGMVFTNLLPGGAAGALTVSDIATLHPLLRRAFQLSRTLPDALLRVFQDETANLPRATEAERLVVQRVGQDIFRRGLLEYWDGRCAITSLAVPELLRASHIKPWADCDSDTERLVGSRGCPGLRNRTASSGLHCDHAARRAAAVPAAMTLEEWDRTAQTNLATVFAGRGRPWLHRVRGQVGVTIYLTNHHMCQLEASG